MPNFTHNAIPINLNDAKEIYELTYMSKYKYNTLDCGYRIYGYLLYHLFSVVYSFIKYNRKINNIPSKFIDLNNSISTNYNKILLFCINKGNGNYSYLDYYKAKVTLEYLFPNPSPYEIVNYSLLNLSFNLSYSMDKKIKAIDNEISLMVTKVDCLYLIAKIIIILFLYYLKSFIIFYN